MLPERRLAAIPPFGSITEELIFGRGLRRREFMILPAATCGFLVTAEHANESRGKSISVEANKAIARRFSDELWNLGNLEIIDELCTDDFIWPIPGGKDMDGAAVKKAIANYRAVFPDARSVEELTIAEDDWVVTRWTTQTTHLPTGKPIMWWGVEMKRFQGGKIAEEWGSSSRLRVKYAGLGPPRTAG